MAYKYSKLGYGSAEDVEAAIALGLIDGKLDADTVIIYIPLLALRQYNTV